MRWKQTIFSSRKQLLIHIRSDFFILTQQVVCFSLTGGARTHGLTRAWRATRCQGRQQRDFSPAMSRPDCNKRKPFFITEPIKSFLLRGDILLFKKWKSSPPWDLNTLQVLVEAISQLEGNQMLTEEFNYLCICLNIAWRSFRLTFPHWKQSRLEPKR